MNTIMKTLQLFCLIVLSTFFGQLAAQTETAAVSQDNSGFRISVRGGYDFPSYDYETPFIDHKGGLEAGTSLDYYWSWFGIGGDFDYIQNKPESTFPTSGYRDRYEDPITQFTLTENKITRLFYGIGPDFRFLINPKSDFEIKLRAGLSSVKGGETKLIGKSESLQTDNPLLLNYHAGFDVQNIFAAKASLQYNYFFSKNVGFSIGGYYMNHFKPEDLKDNTLGISGGYMVIPENNMVSEGYFNLKEEPFKGKLQSFGVFAGLVFKFDKKEKTVIPEVPKMQECAIAVTAKDKYTKEIIPNTQVMLMDESGTTAQKGVTDSSGSIVFANVGKGNYTVSGNYQSKDLEGNTVIASEFADCAKNGGIKKDIFLNDESFIVTGKVVNCKDSQPIANASVIIKNSSTGNTETVSSDSNGEFTFRAAQNTTYSIYGKKANYMSQTVTLNTKDYSRNKSQYIQLQICMDKAECNDAIVLKNILYDLDKAFIREDAKPELNRLVQFMKDNPDVVVELSSHTDSRGSDAYNQKLSQRRAQSAVDYIISEGIAKSRLIAKGYGETQLLNKCGNGVKCTEDEHQLNRRTEMKVICKNK